jgi:hypothetical protein
LRLPPSHCVSSKVFRQATTRQPASAVIRRVRQAPALQSTLRMLHSAQLNEPRCERLHRADPWSAPQMIRHEDFRSTLRVIRPYRTTTATYGE